MYNLFESLEVIALTNEVANVAIYTKSIRTYEVDIENVISTRDCLGNHLVSNWIEAIEKLDLQSSFYVDTMETCIIDERVQYKILLDCERNHLCDTLDVASNRVACANAFKRW